MACSVRTDKGGVRGDELRLVGLHVKGAYLGKSFPSCRNWEGQSLRDQQGPKMSTCQRIRSTENKKA